LAAKRDLKQLEQHINAAWNMADLTFDAPPRKHGSGGTIGRHDAGQDPLSPHGFVDAAVYRTQKNKIAVADATLYWLSGVTGIRQKMTAGPNEFVRNRLPGEQASYLL
jgi:hypothetical protein